MVTRQRLCASAESHADSLWRLYLQADVGKRRDRRSATQIVAQTRTGSASQIAKCRRVSLFTFQNKSPEFGSVGTILKQSDLGAAHEHRDQSNQCRATQSEPGQERLSLKTS